MANYYIGLIDSPIRSFSMVGHGVECKFTFSQRYETDVFKDIEKDDKIIGYLNTPLSSFNYIFTVEEKVDDNTCILIKEFEVSNGLPLGQADLKMQDIVERNIHTKPLLSINEEDYNDLILRMLNINARSIQCSTPDYNWGKDLVFKTGLQSDISRNQIIFGAPGTGKSYKLKQECNNLLNDKKGTFERVTFHPEYSYSNFVGTYKPVTDSNNNIIYAFVPGPFLRVLVAAYKSGRSSNPQAHILIIEEINRAKAASVFGDVFQLLDRDEDGVSEYSINPTEDIKKFLVKELGGEIKQYEEIKIPNNMFIWASMNSADQGVYPMDTAFKRRWDFKYLGIDDNEKDVKGLIKLGNDEQKEVDWNKLRKAINRKLLKKEFHITEDKLLGPYFLHKEIFAYGADGKILNPEKFKEAFKSKVLMYLYEDAAKQHRESLFENADSSKYSSVCRDFDEKGIAIFGITFKEAYYDKQE